MVCVNRLAPSVTTDTVTCFLKKNNIIVHSCFKVGNTKHSVVNNSSVENDDSDAATVGNARNYSMMRICVSQLDLPKIMSEHL